MRLEDVVIAWTPLTWDWHPTTGTIRLGLVRGSDWKRAYGLTDGAVMTDWKTLSAQEREARMLGLFHDIVVQGHIDQQVAHEAFLEIDEYRGLPVRGLAPEIIIASHRESAMADVFVNVARTGCADIQRTRRNWDTAGDLLSC